MWTISDKRNDMESESKNCHDWIKLFRKITEWQWYGQPDMMTLFIHLLIHASDADEVRCDIPLKRGQVLTSQARILEKLDIGRGTLRHCLKRLMESGEITLEACNKHTLITIRNYDLYQRREIPTKREEIPIVATINTTPTPIDYQLLQDLKADFERFRKLYPGRKRGHETELKTLQKHKDWKEVIPLLLPAVKLYAEQTKGSKYIKNLQTWLNNRCWETEYQQTTNLNNDRILKNEPIRQARDRITLPSRLE